MTLIVNDEIINQFHENGFCVIAGFLNLEEVERLKASTTELVKKYCQDMPTSIFSAKDDYEFRDTYFAESGDKIRGFYEEAAVDTDGHIIIHEKGKALNKIGHALHKFEPAFHSVTFSPKVKDITSKLTKIQKPTIIQSMVIFKHPKVGGAVQPHQDSSYLYTEPCVGKLLGFWIALDEASVENGCLNFVPGSHKHQNVYQRFIRNSDKLSEKLFVHQGNDVPCPDKEKLVAAPAKPGDLVLIDGLVIHQSEPNKSDKPRLAYTFHVVDSSASYSKENWLQPTSEGTFMSLD